MTLNPENTSEDPVDGAPGGACEDDPEGDENAKQGPRLGAGV